MRRLIFAAAIAAACTSSPTEPAPHRPIFPGEFRLLTLNGATLPVDTGLPDHPGTLLEAELVIGAGGNWYDRRCWNDGAGEAWCSIFDAGELHYLGTVIESGRGVAPITVRGDTLAYELGAEALVWIRSQLDT